MGSPISPFFGINQNLYGQIIFNNFKLIENGLIYTNQSTGKQYIILELI